jgi:hypothetical protein
MVVVRDDSIRNGVVFDEHGLIIRNTDVVVNHFGLLVGEIKKTVSLLVVKFFSIKQLIEIDAIGGVVIFAFDMRRHGVVVQHHGLILFTMGFILVVRWW